MKFLLDQGLPRGACADLAAAGIDAQHVGDLGMSQADDSVILQQATHGNYTVVTLDADFHRLLAISRARHPSVIRIRIEGLKSEQLAIILIDVLAKCQNDLNRGAMVSVDSSRIRLHQLPLP
jgi:predicted nuclease of predicted toxin-antitoxin system